MTLPFQELKSGFLAHPLGAQACFMAALTKRMRKEFCVRPRYIVSVEIQVSSVTTVRSLKRWEEMRHSVGRERTKNWAQNSRNLLGWSARARFQVIPETNTTCLHLREIQRGSHMAGPTSRQWNKINYCLKPLRPGEVFLEAVMATWNRQIIYQSNCPLKFSGCGSCF